VSGIALAQHTATVTLNLAAAVAIGAAASMLWLRDGASAWAAHTTARLRPLAMACIAVALVASSCMFWLEAASMAEVSVWAAGPAVLSMATATHYGMAWCAGLFALAVALCMLGSSRFQGGVPGSLIAMTMYFYTRSMVSHAADEGDISLPLAADWLHLIAVSLWVGEVVVAGLFTMRASLPVTADRAALGSYVERLSSSATMALAGIVVTGLYGAWRNVGALEHLTGSAYGLALLYKLSAVFMAVLLGGGNRFFVMPGLLRSMATASPATRRFRTVLQIEAMALIVVLILAALLSSTAPPTAG
jgi:putative copper resistance protein D